MIIEYIKPMEIEKGVKDDIDEFMLSRDYEWQKTEEKESDPERGF